jgi:hypothetical protein
MWGQPPSAVRRAKLGKGRQPKAGGFFFLMTYRRQLLFPND